MGDGTNQVRARFVDDEHKKLWEAVKTDVGAENSTEALEALLDAYDDDNSIVSSGAF